MKIKITNKINTKEYLMEWRGYHEKEVAWVAAKDMVNAKELVKHFKETTAIGSNKMKSRH